MSIRPVIFWVGLDAHKDSIMAAVFRGRDREPLRVDRIPTTPSGSGATGSVLVQGNAVHGGTRLAD